MKIYYTTTPAGDFRLFKKGDAYHVHTMINMGAGKPIAVGGFDILTDDESVALANFEKYSKMRSGRDVVIFPIWA